MIRIQPPDIAQVERDRLSSLIIYDDEINHGIPTVKGKNISVDTVLEHFANGDITVDLINWYGLTRDEVRACLLEAARMAKRHQYKSHGFRLPKNYYTDPHYMEDPSDEDWHIWYNIVNENIEVP